MDDFGTTGSKAETNHGHADAAVGGIDRDSFSQTALAGTPARTTSAREQVFGTNELLETILLQLPMREIFVVQSVARSWQDAIAACPAIQEKLFLRRSEKPLETWMLVNAKGEYAFPRANFVRWLVHDEISRSDWGTGFRLVDTGGLGKDKLFAPVTVNALLKPAPPPFGPTTDKQQIWDFTDHTELGWTYSAHSRILEKACASLRNTFISDPPCQCAQVTVSLTYVKVQEVLYGCRLDGGPDRVVLQVGGISVKANDGIKMAHIFYAVLRGRGTCSRVNYHGGGPWEYAFLFQLLEIHYTDTSTVLLRSACNRNAMSRMFRWSAGGW